jgi:predicted MFS family arabinose efflux permease
MVGGVVYEHYGMNAPLIITAAVLAFMLVFALVSRRLRDSVALETASVEPAPQ